MSVSASGDQIGRKEKGKTGRLSMVSQWKVKKLYDSGVLSHYPLSYTPGRGVANS